MKANVRMDCVLLRGSAIRLVSFSLPWFGLPAYGMAQGVSGQRTFSKPSEGVQALVAAARSGDHAQLLAVLGSHAKDLIDSGDPVADKKALDHFVKLYAQKFASDPGKQNGLYWEVAAGKPQSPMGQRLRKRRRRDTAAVRSPIMVHKTDGSFHPAAQGGCGHIHAGEWETDVLADSMA